MDVVVEYIVQLGALGLLTYLIVWLTRVGAPELFSNLNGIQTALEKNTKRLENMERKHDELIHALIKNNKAP